MMHILRGEIRMLQATLSVLFCLLSSLTCGQSHYMLDRLTGFTFSGQVHLQWTLKKGNTCYGIGIYRSVNGSDFSRIGEIAGECGSPESPMTYIFTDENPVPGRINQYILELGIWGRSEPALSIFPETATGTAFRVVPNPISEEGRIYFPNPDNTLHYLHMYDATGRQLTWMQSNEPFFDLSGSVLFADKIQPLRAVVLYFRILDEKRTQRVAGIFMKN